LRNNKDFISETLRLSVSAETETACSWTNQQRGQELESWRFCFQSGLPHQKEPSMNVILWVLQSLLALVFLFSGGLKLAISTQKMREMSPPNTIMLPGAFVKFIGVLEILGGLGLILPGLTKIRHNLTPLAAMGLLIIMIGAVVITIMGPGVSAAILPFVVGVLCAVIAYGRRDWLAR
jgi:uncharacterized membrane protein YphA (DoxX/SURF4 family)